MSKSKVLKPFDYSFDGVTPLKAVVGDEIDFGDMTRGLTKEKYIEPVAKASKSESTPPAETPPETEPEPIPPTGHVTPPTEKVMPAAKKAPPRVTARPPTRK